MLREAFMLLCVHLMFENVFGDGFYTVIAPGTIRSYSKYNVAIILHEAQQPCVFHVAVHGVTYNGSVTVKVKPLELKLLKFDMPKLIGRFRLDVTGLRGMSVKNYTQLITAEYSPVVLVQTDKETFVPGDLIRYWVLLLNESTQPMELRWPTQVVITDGGGHVVFHEQPLRLHKGVYDGQFQLTTQPALGKWMITVHIEGVHTMYKEIEVVARLKPKFRVSIETPKIVALQDGWINVTIHASYHSGVALHGKATVLLLANGDELRNKSLRQTTQTSDILGKASLQFDIRAFDWSTKLKLPVQLLAVIEEHVSHAKQSATETIKISKQRYEFEPIAVPTHFYTDLPLQYKLGLRYVNDTPVLSSTDPVKLIITHPIKNVNKQLEKIYKRTVFEPLVLTSYLDEAGVATFNALINDPAQKYLRVRAEYKDVVLELSAITLSDHQLQHEQELKPLRITVHTPNPRIGQPLELLVTSSSIMSYLVYVVIARGSLLQAHIVKDINRHTHAIELITSFSMVPSLAVYVHYVAEGELKYEEVVISIQQQFENYLTIEVPEIAKPGEEIQLKVGTSPYSAIGLLAVNFNTFALNAEQAFNKSYIFDKLERFKTRTAVGNGHGHYPGQISGLVTLTNAHHFFEKSPVSKQYHEEAGPKAVEDLPEQQNSRAMSISVREALSSHTQDGTWLWFFKENTSKKRLRLLITLPELQTIWAIIGFSINPETGIAVVEEPQFLKAERNFFLSAYFPYPVKFGEILRLPVYLSNNYDSNFNANVTLYNKNNEIQWILDGFRDQTSTIVTVQRNSYSVLNFTLRPLAVGLLTITIRVSTNFSQEMIETVLSVIPEGIEQEIRKTRCFDLSNRKEPYKNNFDVKLPLAITQKSMHIEFSAVGDVLGPPINRLDEIMHEPKGDAEQTLADLMQVIYVYEYLQATGKLTHMTKAKGITYIKMGCEHLLKHKREDGAYSALKSDKYASTWLTAHVVRTFQRAATHVHFHHAHIVDGLKFLATMQAPRGQFLDKGQIYDDSNRNDVVLTCIVLLSFVQVEFYRNQYQGLIGTALDYVYDEMQRTTELYGLVLGAYLLQLSGQKTAMLKHIELAAKMEGDLLWWETDAPAQPHRLHLWRPSNKILITATMLMTFLEAGRQLEDLMPIVNWLCAQRDHLGGYTTPQATAIGLEALAKFAHKIKNYPGARNIDVNLMAYARTRMHGGISINASNAMIRQQLVLPSKTQNVSFSASGIGNACLQLTYHYYIKHSVMQPWFKLLPTVEWFAALNELHLNICVAYTPPWPKHKHQHGPPVLELGLPTGFVPDDAYLQLPAMHAWIKSLDTRMSDATIVMQLLRLPVNDFKCLSIKAQNVRLVAAQKDAQVHVYELHQRSHGAIASYSVYNTLCEICAPSECQAQCGTKDLP